jgi:tetratricopeptide (TPR) repeat protein
MKNSTRILVALACVAALALGVLPAQAQAPDKALSEKTTLVLKKMRDEKISAQKAFDNKLLTGDVLLYALGEKEVLDPGDAKWNGAPETMAWAQLLVEQFPELLEKPGALSPIAQIKVMRWLLSQKDARVETLAESILKNNATGKPDLENVGSALYTLSSYYQEKGETEKAIATALRIEEFSKDPQKIGSHIFYAVSIATQAGDKARAQQLIDKIIGYGNGELTGRVYMVMANQLSREGKLEEARAVLQKPIAGEGAELARIQLDSQLMQSYFSRGEWDEARKWAKTTIEHYNALSEDDKKKKEYLKWTIENAKNIPGQIEQWQKGPVQTYNTQIRVRVAPGETEPVRTYFNVNSYRDFTVKGVADNPAISVWPLQSPQDYDMSAYQMVGVEIAPAALQKSGKAELTVSFDEFPNTTLKIPIVIEVIENGDKNEDE